MNTQNEMHLEETGSGPALVLIHGFPGNAKDWRHVIPILAQHHRVIVPDLLGFGQSSKPTTFAELWAEAQAEALSAALNQRGVREFALVGHDYGGPVAVLLASQRNEDVTHIVLSSCNVFRDPPLQLPMRLLPYPIIGKAIETTLFSAPAIEFMGKMGTQTATLHPVSNTAEEVRSIRLIFANALRDLTHTFGVVQDHLPSLTMPVLVAWGDHDSFFPLAHARRVTESLPLAQLTIYERIGHFPHIEAASAYAKDILQHLTTVAPTL